jgi:hypothetical protein
MEPFGKVALFVRQARNSVFELYAKKCDEYFAAKGVQSRIFQTVQGALDAGALKELKQYAPQLTISFSAMDLHQEAALPGLLGAPHLVWFKDPGFFAVPFLKTEGLYFGVTNHADALWFEQCGSRNSFFLPYPALEEWKIIKEAPRDFPVLVFGSERTSFELKQEWENEFSRPEMMVLEGALNGYIDNLGSSLLEQVTESIRYSEIAMRGDMAIKIFDHLAAYITCWEKEQLVQAAQEVVEVVYAPLLPLPNMLEWMQRADVVIAGTFGSSISVELEAAALSGAYPIFCTNPFLEELFPQLGVERNGWARASNQIHELFANPEQRKTQVAQMQKTILNNLSLEQFIKTITSQMSSRLHT